MDPELKALLEEQGKLIAALKATADEQHEVIEAFKAANDEMQAEIKSYGSADTVTANKVQVLNDKLDEFEDLNQRITGAQKSIDAAMAKQAETEADQGKKLDDQGKQLDRIETAMNRPGLGDPDDEATAGAKKAREVWFKHLRHGEFGPGNHSPNAVSPEDIKVLTIGDDTQAGYLAPTEYIREIIKAVIEFSPIRLIARVRSTSFKSIEIPKRTGVFAAVWVGETESRSETTGLTYGLEEIFSHELTAEVYISNAMLEDSVFNLETELTEEFVMQFGVAEGTAFVNGNAVKRPEGFMTNADILSTNSGSAADISDANGQANGLIDLQHAIKTEYARNGTWVLNRTTLGSVRKLKDGNNQYIWVAGVSAGLPNTIFGDPYVEATDMPDEGTNTFPMAYGDFRRAYTIVDRIVMAVLRDPFTRATQGQIKFVARRRTGGQVVLAEAIRKLKCST